MDDAVAGKKVGAAGDMKGRGATMKVPKDAKREREGHSHVAVIGKQ